MRRTESMGAGFTLIEVMIAMSLLAVAVLGIVGAQLSAIKFTRDSHLRAQAMFLAEQRIEDIQAMSAPNVIALAGTTNDPDNPIDPTPGNGDATSFNRNWVIALDNPETDVITITVNVDWTDSLGVVRRVSLQTMKAS